MMKKKKKIKEQVVNTIKTTIIAYVTSIVVSKVIEIILINVTEKLETKKTSSMIGDNENE